MLRQLPTYVVYELLLFLNKFPVGGAMGVIGEVSIHGKRGTMATNQHLTALQEQLEEHRIALRELWVQKASHEQAISAIKATLQASGLPCDTSPYDGPGYSNPLAPVTAEALQFVERALGGPRAMAKH